MAVMFDINLLCKKIIDFNFIKKILFDYDINIISASSIDNWMWENEQQIRKTESIEEKVDESKIIVLKLDSQLFKDAGLYIEKINKEFLYTLWINTEGYPQLDCDTINIKNKIYYEKAYQAILKLSDEKRDILKMVGIGIETDFYYCENEVDILQNSKNVVAWILNDNINEKGVLNKYRQRIIKGTDKIVFENVTNY